jgi:hypothetical protein
MFARYDQGMARMKLPKIDKSHGEIVFVNDAGRHPASDDLTKRALELATVHSPNENKMSGGGRGRALLVSEFVILPSDLSYGGPLFAPSHG